MKERIFIKDKVDGQQHCISGDEQFYLIDVTENYSPMTEIKIDAILEWMKNARREVINILDNGLMNGVITQKERDIFYFRHIDFNSLSNCGEKFGLTRERIRQIEAKALEKLKNIPLT